MPSLTRRQRVNIHLTGSSPAQGSFLRRKCSLPKRVFQTVIRMGAYGDDKNNPDIYAVRVLDYILGGITSRLMMEITNRGLAYHVGS